MNPTPRGVDVDNGTPLDTWNILIGESDRGCVLVGAALVDEYLGSLLRAAFIEGVADRLLIGERAVVGHFAARCHVARAIGLIDAQEYADLDLVRKVRNEGAHFERKRGLDTGFSNEVTKGRCLELSMAKLLSTAYAVPVAALHPKAVFCVTIAHCTAMLSSRTKLLRDHLARAHRWDALATMMKFVDEGVSADLTVKALRDTGRIDPTRSPSAV
jgi:hypothetical protein